MNGHCHQIIIPNNNVTFCEPSTATCGIEAPLYVVATVSYRQGKINAPLGFATIIQIWSKKTIIRYLSISSTISRTVYALTANSSVEAEPPCSDDKLCDIATMMANCVRSQVVEMYSFWPVTCYMKCIQVISSDQIGAKTVDKYTRDFGISFDRPLRARVDRPRFQYLRSWDHTFLTISTFARNLLHHC